MNHILKSRLNFIYTIIAISFLLFSCSNKIGYGVLLWDIPERNLQDGDIVAVYLRSNISNTYAISSLDSNERFDVPLWQITSPKSKFGAKKLLANYEEYIHQYATVKLDGLPVRESPINTSRQVYRLRKGEVVKLLYSGEGQAVMAGKDELEGKWLKILAKDGSEGWCFSYNLSQFQTEKGGNIVGGNQIADIDTTDEVFESIANKVWYPDYYREMIESNKIDVEKMNASYFFEIATDTKKVSINLPENYGSWEYESVSKNSDVEYKFDNTPIKVIYRGNYIVVTVSDDIGRPRDYNFILLDESFNISDIVSSEKNRRTEKYIQLFDFGPDFRSANYGQLTFKRDGTFIWRNYKRLVPSVISDSAKSGGTVEIKYLLDSSLSATFDGVLSFQFEGQSSEVNFFYKIDSSGIRLEDAKTASLEGNTFTERGMSPLVLYFEKK